MGNNTGLVIRLPSHGPVNCMRADQPFAFDLTAREWPEGISSVLALIQF